MIAIQGLERRAAAHIETRERIVVAVERDHVWVVRNIKSFQRRKMSYVYFARELIVFALQSLQRRWQIGG